MIQGLIVMIRKPVFLISLIAVLLLAGICACKQEVAPEKPVENDPIPKWEKSDAGIQNLPDINTFGTETAVSSALVNGLKNPPAFSDVKNLIVMVCEGLTSELIDSSASQYGELIIINFPVKGTTTSKFTDGEKPLADYVINDLFKLKTGIVAWGDTSANSLRRMTTTDDNSVAGATVNYNQFMFNPPFVYIMGKGDFKEAFAADSLNYMYKAKGYAVSTLEEAIPLYMNDEVLFTAPGHEGRYSSVNKLYTIFENDSTLPTYRQEMAFSLAWMQSVKDSEGFCLLSAYSPASPLDAIGVQDFDEGVALAVKYVLENPDTVLLICGCPVDGSEASVCFYGLGSGVSAGNTMFESVSSLFD